MYQRFWSKPGEKSKEDMAFYKQLTFTSTEPLPQLPIPLPVIRPVRVGTSALLVPKRKKKLDKLDTQNDSVTASSLFGRFYRQVF
jgi:hypothetical protein